MAGPAEEDVLPDGHGVLHGEPLRRGLERLSGERGPERPAHGLRHRRRVADGDQPPPSPPLQNLPRAAGAVRRDDVGAAGQCLHEDVGEPLASRGEHERGGSRHPGVGVRLEAREVNVLRYAEFRRQALETPPVWTVPQQNEPCLRAPGKHPEGPQQIGLISAIAGTAAALLGADGVAVLVGVEVLMAMALIGGKIYYDRAL